jgi:hypothetical protein
LIGEQDTGCFVLLLNQMKSFCLTGRHKMPKCISCSQRKGKRTCPSLGSSICSQCCGTKRKIEIDCPDDCFYLQSSQHYVVERQSSRQLADFEREMKSIIGKEGEYLDVLQNIEFTLFEFYRERGTINDRDVETALEYLFETGKAQLDLPSKALPEPSLIIKSLIEDIEDILDFRESLGGKSDLMTQLKCIYRVMDSVKNHYNPRDEYSYLDFIGGFMLHPKRAK